MELRTFARGFEISEAVESYLDEKLEKVRRALKDYATREGMYIEARFDKDGPYYTLRLQMHFNGKDIVVQEKANDVYGVIDAASDSFEKAIKKEREYYKSHHKANMKGTIEAMAEELTPKYSIEDEEYEQIDSVKRVFLRTVSLEEALEQMEVMNHAFFVFRNAETGELNMLYRKNGKYGLIEFEE
uniref:HPF/RaiA family ribosome-associated protein n=1 Tax=Fervidobacterium thailandense TaxID=1008305 RepID=A0A7C5RIJ5_9BACT